MSAAKSPEVVDGMIGDTLLGILIILLVVMLSTGYVYVQQLRQGNAPQHGTANPLARMAPSTAAALSSVPECAAISTANLNERQLRLHNVLPLRNGVRCITISSGAILKTENPDALAWTDDKVPAMLADLSHVADVHLLCMVKDGNDTNSMQRIREFVATHPDLKGNDVVPGGIKTHKILFCTTTIGKIAFVRQIEPHIHVEVDGRVARELEKHVPQIIHIPVSPEYAATPFSIHKGNSFTGYFAMISAKERA